MLYAGAGTSYILISIFKYSLDFTSLQVKSYKQLQIYENEHLQLEYRSTSYIFQVRLSWFILMIFVKSFTLSAI